MVGKTERGHVSLFGETDKLVKRIRRTNLEGLREYVNGEKLRVSLIDLVKSWDKFTYEVGETRGKYPVRVKVFGERSEEGGKDGS
jgi:hypothetical protein